MCGVLEDQRPDSLNLTSHLAPKAAELFAARSARAPVRFAVTPRVDRGLETGPVIMNPGPLFLGPLSLVEPREPSHVGAVSIVSEASHRASRGSGRKDRSSGWTCSLHRGPPRLAGGGGNPTPQCEIYLCFAGPEYGYVEPTNSASVLDRHRR